MDTGAHPFQENVALSSTSMDEQKPLERTPKFGKITIKAKLYGTNKNQDVDVSYRIFFDSSGQPCTQLPLLLYAPYINQQRSVEDPDVGNLADRIGFNLFTFDIRTQPDDADDRLKCYYYPESGWPEAMVAGYKGLRQKFNLAEDGFYLLGNSGGGSVASRMGELFPSLVKAVVCMGAGRLDESTAKLSQPMLMIYTMGDSRAKGG